MANPVKREETGSPQRNKKMDGKRNVRTGRRHTSILTKMKESFTHMYLILNFTLHPGESSHPRIPCHLKFCAISPFHPFILPSITMSFSYEDVHSIDAFRELSRGCLVHRQGFLRRPAPRIVLHIICMHPSRHLVLIVRYWIG